MKEEFIPHQEALELEQLGFDEPCFGYWKSPTWLIEIVKQKQNDTH